MRFEDPLEDWLTTPPTRMSNTAKTDILEQIRTAFETLTELLENTPATSHPKYRDTRLSRLSRMSFVLPPSDLTFAKRLYRKVDLRKGAGSTRIKDGLLELIGTSVNPSSIPFWQELLEPSRSRNSYSNRQRTYGLASIALLAIQTSAECAMEALQEAMAGAHQETRAMAARYLSRVYLETGRTVPDKVVEALTDLAVNDKAFEPRLMARMALASLEQEVPTDNPGGAYELKVWHSGDWSVYRIIKMGAEQTLDHLHFAIQDAWDWDDDHMYSFYMTGKLYDVRYEFGHEVTDGLAAYYAHEVTLGELGLRPRHKFLYLFDFGDKHGFWVTVKRIHLEAGPDPLPLIVDGKGDTMPQYPDWD